MDGSEFEGLCKRILEGAGWGSVETHGGGPDGGIDLVVHEPGGGKIAAECKRWKGSVGRPVVQKLHSAAGDCGARKGVILTTGSYTRGAVEYARRITNPPVELYGRDNLADLAQKSGIRLVDGRERLEVHCFPAHGMGEIRAMLSGVLDPMISHPWPARAMCEVVPSRVLLSAHYLVRADIRHEFPARRNLPPADEKGATLMFFARDGTMVSEGDARFLERSRLIKPYQIPALPCPVIEEGFKMDRRAAERCAVAEMVSRHTRAVTYAGPGGREQTEQIAPRPGSVTITETKQVFVPRYMLRLRFLRSSYDCLLIQNDVGVRIKSSGLDACSVCGGKIAGAALLCNSCGAVAHPPKAIGSHSHACASCKMTLCGNCAVMSGRRPLQRALCGGCAAGRGRGAGRPGSQRP